MQVLGLAEIQLAEDFSFEGAWEWSLKCEKHEICAICVKSTDLAVIWLNKFLSGEFRGKMVIIMSNLWVTQLLGQNKFLSGEFLVFCGKWSFVFLGVTIEVC